MKKRLNKFEAPCADDERLDVIEARFGLCGYAVVMKLYARICASNGYFCRFDDEIATVLAARLGIEARRLTDIVIAAAELGIFDCRMLREYSILTSEELQEYYFRATRRTSGIVYDERYVIGDHYKQNRTARSQGSTVSVASAIKPASAAEKATDAVSDTAAVGDSTEADNKIGDTHSGGDAATTSDRATGIRAALPEVDLERPISEIIEEKRREMEAERMEATDNRMKSFGALISEYVSAISAGSGSVGEDADKADAPTEATGEGEAVGEGERRFRSYKTYGKKNNVILDDADYAYLCESIPNAGDYIDRLSVRLLDKSFKAGDHYDAIINCYRLECERKGIAISS